MTLALDLPSCADSPLGRRDPRWKLVAVGFALVAVCTLRTVPGAGLSLAGALLLAWLGRVPRGWLLRRLGMTALVLLPFAGLMPFLVHAGGQAWQVGSVCVSLDGVLLGVQLLAKSLALVTLVLVTLATTPLPALLHAAHALRVPGLLVQLCLLTYRYIWLLAEEFGRLRTALRTRGYRNRMSRHNYRTIGHVTGTLLVRSQERAERVGQAMRCRGFDGRFRSVAVFRSGPADVALGALVLAAASLLVLGDYLLR